MHILTPLIIKHDLGMITVSDANDKTCFSGHSYKENIELANHIVKAVNNHKKLMEALQELLELYNADDGNKSLPQYKKAKQALSQANA